MDDQLPRPAPDAVRQGTVAHSASTRTGRITPRCAGLTSTWRTSLARREWTGHPIPGRKKPTICKEHMELYFANGVIHLVIGSVSVVYLSTLPVVYLSTIYMKKISIIEYVKGTYKLIKTKLLL